MKVSIFSTYDTDGGAAIATLRLFRGLRSIGVDATMVVQRKFSDDPYVKSAHTTLRKIEGIVRPYVDSASLRRYPQRGKALFSPAAVPDRIRGAIAETNPDILHFFWMNGGFLRIETLKNIARPVVWTLHDMWPFTGGCHYDAECGRYRHSCGACPALGSTKERDLSRKIWQRKHAAWAGVPIVVVATSQWIADMAKASTIFRNKRIELIPNNVEIGRYKPVDKGTARDVWNLPRDKQLVLFSAFSATSDKRKGHELLTAAIRALVTLGYAANMEMVVIGASQAPSGMPDLGVKVNYVGRLYDELSQVLLYSAADVVVAPSMQENLSNTVMEAMACGTPVVAYNIGGMPDMIDHLENGYLAKAFDTEDLAQGIRWVLQQTGESSSLNVHARQTVVSRYNKERVAKLNFALYEDILAKRSI